MSRGRNTAPQTPAGHPAQHHPVHHPAGKSGWGAKTVRIEAFIILVGCALVLLALLLLLVFGSDNNESGKVQKDKYQAVFLNGGSTSGSVAYTTYFGHIASINDQYVVLKDVYYLTTAQATANEQANPQLTKLGCQQLHSPYDVMYVNRDQVAFWENLQDSGKVVQAIKEFQKQNPNGPDCNASTGGTQQNPQSTQGGQSTQNTQSQNSTNSGGND